MRLARAAALVLVLSASAAAHEVAASEPVLVPADEAALERAFAENDVETRFSDGRGSDFLWYAFERLATRFSKVFEAGAFAVLGQLWIWVAAFAGLVCAALALVVVRLKGGWRRRHGAGEAAEQASTRLPIVGPASAALWRERAESRLEAGDLRGALEAIWWWLASLLAAGAVDPAWTGRELLRRVGRPELLPAVRQLDAFRYGRAAPEVDAVRRYFDQLRGALA